MLTDINNVPIEEALKINGYVIVDNLISEEQLLKLRDACERVINKARSGEWKHCRLVGTQFPPWTKGDDVWGVQHVLHPELGEPVFMEWYGSDALLNAVCQLLDTKRDGLQFELFNLLVNPQHHDFDLTWHRDAIPVGATHDMEEQLLAIPHYGTQWNTALYEDDCLFVVPNSHRRIRTDKERDITINDPKSHDMPNQLQVNLKPGQTVFYDNNILHRAAYFSNKKRATLHASMGTIDGGYHRAKTVFQHGLDWMNTDAFKATLIDSLEIPFANTQSMATRAGLDKFESQPIH
ncbi:hypothetical protein BC941DRAFT_460577 [Chlamydoabsidia padenii]|nr:hypothetical protein BC941DRAFT_460577 [Chlamydoabsidia padenii]